MAEWIGHLLTDLPAWLFIPALIIIIILSIVTWWLWSMFSAAAQTSTVWPFKPRRAYLGEKKDAKK
jgi:uncharacterized membrane protein YqiK